MLTPRPSNPFGERTLLTAAKFAFTKHHKTISERKEIPGLEGYDVLKIFTQKSSNLGFRGVVFENDKGNRIYAISGTDNEVPDWLSNTNLGLSQFQSTAGRTFMKHAADFVRSGRGRIAFTGNSLGGGLAQAMAYQVAHQTGKPGIIMRSWNGFGGASLLNRTPFRIDKNVIKSMDARSYGVEEDLVYSLGRHVGETWVLPADPLIKTEAGRKIVPNIIWQRHRISDMEKVLDSEGFTRARKIPPPQTNLSWALNLYVKKRKPLPETSTLNRIVNEVVDATDPYRRGQRNLAKVAQIVEFLIFLGETDKADDSASMPDATENISTRGGQRQSPPNTHIRQISSNISESSPRVSGVLLSDLEPFRQAMAQEPEGLEAALLKRADQITRPEVDLMRQEIIKMPEADPLKNALGINFARLIDENTNLGRGFAAHESKPVTLEGTDLTVASENIARRVSNAAHDVGEDKAVKALQSGINSLRHDAQQEAMNNAETIPRQVEAMSSLKVDGVAGPKTRAGVRQGLVTFGETPVQEAFREKLDLFTVGEEEDFVDPLEGFLG